MGTLFYGDHKPASWYKGDKKIGGYKKSKLSGTGSVGFDAPYKASLPSVSVSGQGKQEKLTGKNIWNSTQYNNIQYVGGDKIRGYYLVNPKEEKTTISIYIDENDKTDCTGCFLGISLDGKTVHAWMTVNNDIGQNVVGNSRVFTDMYIVISPNNEETFTKLNKHFKYQIEEGSVATPYEPYCGGIPAPNPEYPIEPEFLEGAEIKARGKNLFKLKESHNYNGIDIIKKDNYFIANGVATMSFNTVTSAYLEEGNYTLSANNPSNSGIPYNLIDVYLTKPFATLYVPDNTNFGVASGHLRSGVYQFRMRFEEGIKYDNFIIKPQLELGTTATAYEPYIPPETANVPILRALPDGSVKDEIDLTTGVITRRIGELVLDGSENWEHYNVSGETLSLFRLPIPLSQIVTGESVFTISQFYLGKSFQARINNSVSSASTGGVDIIDNRYAQVEQFTQYLKDQYSKGTPVKVWYALKEPVTELVDPQILNQHPGYTELKQVGGFKQTDISVTAYEKAIVKNEDF